jgi:molecular chaperone DnaK
MAYGVEKNIKEFGDKIDASEKAKIEDAIVRVKKAIEGGDIDAIKKAQEDLTNASHKLAEAMYAKSTSQEGPGPQAGAGAGAGAQAGTGTGKKDDDVVDADFEEVK